MLEYAFNEKVATLHRHRIQVREHISICISMNYCAWGEEIHFHKCSARFITLSQISKNVLPPIQRTRLKGSKLHI